MSNVFDKNSVGTPLTALLNYIRRNGKHGAYFLHVSGTALVVVEINNSTKAFYCQQSSTAGHIDSEICISSKDLSVLLSECSESPKTLLYQIFEPDNTNGLEKNGISIERIGEFLAAYKK